MRPAGGILGEGVVKVGERAVEVAERCARLRSNVEQLDADRPPRVQPRPGGGELPGFPDGELVERPPGRAQVGLVAEKRAYVKG